ncbi:hypothetical protein [Halorubrum laminariae]|uniref:Uncharacterized protein n=1 Tax=Halorubrum laminariae TaxID=1433523 RepID=A0ABD6C429_9EURY|nr:hypothetical protein [Halorubrum laminariae]
MTDNTPPFEFDELHGLRDHLIEQFDEELVTATLNVIEGNGNITEAEYRVAVAQEFCKLVGGPPKKKAGNRYRTGPESALDRAFTGVASAFDISESTVRERCVHTRYDEPSATEQFRDDLQTICRQVQDTE